MYTTLYFLRLVSHCQLSVAHQHMATRKKKTNHQHMLQEKKKQSKLHDEHATSFGSQGYQIQDFVFEGIFRFSFEALSSRLPR